MRDCSICKRSLPPEAYQAKTIMCRECKSEKDRGRWRSPANPDRESTPAARARKRRWQAEKADPLKMAARYAVRRAIKTGILVAPDTCQDCGNSSVRRDGRRAIQAHHHMGYDKPLEVEWLCPRCHRKHDDAARTAAIESDRATLKESK